MRPAHQDLQMTNSERTSQAMKFSKSVLFVIGLATIAALVACSSSKSTPPPPPAITVTLSGAPSSLAANATASITATVANDSANAGVNWSCAPAGSCGSFSPANPVASGTAVTYTAPAAAGSVTVTATSVTDNTKSASSQITVTSSAPTTLADGNYVFYVSGTDASTVVSADSNYFYTGMFSVVGGAITAASGQPSAGEQDFGDANYFTRAEPITGGTITASADGNLLITLTFDATSETYIGNGTGQVTFDATLVTSSRALLTEYDGFASGTGELDAQSTTLAAPAGGYAFDENGAQGLTFSLGGVVNVDGSGTISGTGSVFDVNNGGTTFPTQTLTASTVTGPDSFGNVTFTLNISGGGSLIFDGYMIDANRMRIIENWYNDSVGLQMGGTALTQTGAGTFAASSIQGSSYVFSATGGDSIGYLDVAGVLTFNSDGSTLGGTLSYNDGTLMNAQGGEAVTGTYAVDATGRVTVAATTASSAFNFQLYLNGASSGAGATAISMDTGDYLGGVSWQQTSSALNAGSLTGSYALAIAQPVFVTPLVEQDAVGPFSSDGSANLTGFFDFNGALTTGSQTPNVAWTGTYATTSANGVLSTNISIQGTSNALTTYLVDGTQGVTIENDTNALTLGYLAQQQ